MYHYFETLKVSKCHFLEGLEIMRPWQESCVEATFLPQNFPKMFGNNEARSIFSPLSPHSATVTPSKGGGAVAGVSLSPSSGAGSPGQVPGGSPQDGFLSTISASAGAAQIAHAKPASQRTTSRGGGSASNVEFAQTFRIFCYAPSTRPMPRSTVPVLLLRTGTGLLKQPPILP